MDDYSALGVDFWGLTAQNEPTDGNVPGFTFNCMGWNSTSQREWIVNNLGPTLEAEGYGDVKLMILDDQRPLAPKWAREVIAMHVIKLENCFLSPIFIRCLKIQEL